jgi:hypothetical protein
MNSSIDLNDENVLNVYQFGSHLYGSNDEHSDEDYIVILKNYVPSTDINIHHISKEDFIRFISNHEIQALECLFSPQEFRLKETENFLEYFKLNLSALRVFISTLTSNSFQKGKKKLTILGDYDERIGIKSVFHSIRILHFDIQIASTGKIHNWSEYNYVLEDCKKLATIYNFVDLWEHIDVKYRKLFNSLSSEFKKLAPKPVEQSLDSKLTKILKDHNVYNDNLFYDLFNLLNV